MVRDFELLIYHSMEVVQESLRNTGKKMFFFLSELIFKSCVAINIHQPHTVNHLELYRLLFVYGINRCRLRNQDFLTPTNHFFITFKVMVSNFRFKFKKIQDKNDFLSS